MILEQTKPWKSVAIGVASSFIFALVLTAANFIQWANPFTSNIPSPQETVKNN